MSARDWQPGDRAYIEVEIEFVDALPTCRVRVLGSTLGDPRVWPSKVDLLPVPQADEGAIERAARAFHESGPTPASWDAAAEHVKERQRERMRHALAAAARVADTTDTEGKD